MKRHATRLSTVRYLFAALLLGSAGPAFADPVCADPEPANPMPKIDPELTQLSLTTVYGFSPWITTCVAISAANTDILVEVVSTDGAQAKMVVQTSGSYAATTVGGSSLSPGDQAAAIVLHPSGSGTYPSSTSFQLPLAVHTGSTGGTSFKVRMTLRESGSAIRVLDTQLVTLP